jgi:hypothetical protein
MRAMTKPENLLRLRKKHGDGRVLDASADDGALLERAQSLRNAVVAGLIALVVFCVLWIFVSSVTNRVFPWMTIILGGMLGFAIRRAGRGLDWRFPTLAAVMAITGAVIGNVVLAASTTAAEYDTGTLHILQAVTSMTWPVFFAEVWTVADGFYAVVAAAYAAFLANRRLTRTEFYALRQWREESDRHQ